MRFVAKVIRRIDGFARGLKYRLLSTNSRIIGRAVANQPILMQGKGQIVFAENVRIGVEYSPGFWSSYCYLESREPSAVIQIGANTSINNNFVAIAEQCSIHIGRDCLIGHDVVVFDSNFHGMTPEARRSRSDVRVGDVVVEDNVFIGSCVTILKNTRIGEGSVVVTGSVVSGNFPARVLIGGQPAVVVRHL